MTRPIYETENDREAERFVMDEIKRVRGWRSYPTHTLSCVDLVITTGEGIKGFGEIRSRKITFGTYEDVIFSAKKMSSIMVLSKITHIPTFIILNLLDGIFVRSAPTTLDGMKVAEGGHNRRGDPQDIEQVCHLPWSSFKRLE